MKLADCRFLLALTTAAAPVVGHLHGQYWHAFLVFFGVIPLLDLAFGRSATPSGPAELERLARSALFRLILYAWVPLQLCLIAWGAWLIGSIEEPVNQVLFTLSVGLATGATGITIAHELGHKRSPIDRLLAHVLLVTVSYGHFPVEHNRGHHVRVATREDPASARYGEGFWRFLPRTLAGSLIDAWRIERAGVLVPWIATLALASLLGIAFGKNAVAFFFGQSAMAILLLEAVNYIEHYGLERRRLPDGRYERPDARHAWDANERLSNCFLVHLQRHADHHLNPSRPYAALQPQAHSPKLPSGYAGMLPIALVPPLWFAVMNRRVPTP